MNRPVRSALLLAVLPVVLACQESRRSPPQAPREPRTAAPPASTPAPVPPAPEPVPPAPERTAASEPVPRSDATLETQAAAAQIVPPSRIAGESFDIFQSGCPSTSARGLMRRTPMLLIRTFIDRDGKVTTVDFPKHEVEECLEDYVLAQLSAWVFEPATLAGEPVAVEHYLLVHIHLR